MIVGIDPNATIDYVSKYDTTEPKTIWKLRGLTVREFAGLRNIMSDADKSIEGMTKIIQMGLRGYENFMGKTSDQIEENFVDRLHIPIIGELSNKIIEISKLTEQAIKNS